MRIGIDAHWDGHEDVIAAGHRPGIIRFGNGAEGVTIYFNQVLYGNDVAPLEQLRDECQRQIDALNGVLPSNAPAEELAAPFISAAPPLEGQPIESQDRGEPVEGEKLDSVERVIVLDDTPDLPF